MKKHKKRIVILSLILGFSLIGLVRSMAATDGGFRYVTVEYLASNTSEHIKETYTAPIAADSSGNRIFVLSRTTMQVSGYAFDRNNSRSGYTDIYSNNNLKRIYDTNNDIEIPVGDDNTVDNPVRVRLYFNEVVNSIPVYVACVYKFPNSTPPDNHMNIANYNMRSNAPLKATYAMDPLVNTLGKYTSCEIKYEYTLGVPVNAPASAGTIANGNINLAIPPVGVQKINVYYYYSATVATSADIAITVIDNFIDPTTGKAVTLSDGRDYFGRVDLAVKKYNLNGDISVVSPSKGVVTLPGFTSSTNLTLNKVVYESGIGDPVDALLTQNQYEVLNVPHPDVNTSTYIAQFKGAARTTPLRQYIHFYWNVAPTTPANTVTVTYIDNNTGASIEEPMIFNNVAAGSQTYSAKDLSGKGYELVGETSQTITVVDGQSYIVTFKYKNVITKIAPTATISAPEKVVIGNDCYISGSGNSQDPNVKSLNGYISFAEGIPGILGSETPGNQISFGGSIKFLQTGIYHAQTTVTDNSGLKGTSQVATIEVLPAMPKVFFLQSGKLKENRKITIDASSSVSGSISSSIDWAKSKWEVTALSGGTSSDIRVQRHTEGETNGEIFVDSSRGINSPIVGDMKAIDLLFKKTGQYKVKLSLTNNFGYTGSGEIILDIKADLPPEADTNVLSLILRDPNDKAMNGKAQATIEINNNSKSNDGDIIVKIGYVFAYDTNNDKNYAEETAYIYDLNYNGSGQIPNEGSSNPYLRPIGKVKDLKSISIDSYNTGNTSQCIIKTTHVGKKYIAVLVKEEFGQHTIPQFVTANDRRTGHNFD